MSSQVLEEFLVVLAVLAVQLPLSLNQLVFLFLKFVNQSSAPGVFRVSQLLILFLRQQQMFSCLQPLCCHFVLSLHPVSGPGLWAASARVVFPHETEVSWTVHSGPPFERQISFSFFPSPHYLSWHLLLFYFSFPFLHLPFYPLTQFCRLSYQPQYFGLLSLSLSQLEIHFQGVKFQM